MTHGFARTHGFIGGTTSFVVLVALIGWLHAVPFTAASQATQYPFQNPDLPMEERISDLIGRMTCLGLPATPPPSST